MVKCILYNANACFLAHNHSRNGISAPESQVVFLMGGKEPGA